MISDKREVQLHKYQNVEQILVNPGLKGQLIITQKNTKSQRNWRMVAIHKSSNS